MRQLPAVPVQPEFIPFVGGADFVTPMLQVPSGYAREAQNYEIDINGGYRRIAGYERFDGRLSPSAQTYAILAPVTLSGVLAVGNVLTDNAGTSFGTVIALPDATTVVLTLITGHFSAGNVKVAGVTVGTCTGAELPDSAATPQLHAQYRNLAADVYRALIGAVPGSGSLRGVWLYNDVVYGFRDNAGATAGAMYKSTASGWTLVSLGEEVSFTNANTAVVDGVTLTQGGVTATVARVVLQTGSLASGVNSGRLILTGRAGGNFAAGAATTSGGGTVTLSGVQTAITLLPGGRFEFVTTNFTGAVATRRMYGCDGKNRAFEFDGTVFVPIATGMTLDTPTHICEHKKQLFLSFGPLSQHSAPGSPYVFNVILGSGAIAMGDDITGYSQLPGGAGNAALSIITRNGLATLYGSGILDWELIPLDQEAGGYAYSIQHIGQTIMLDDRGVTSVSATQAFGNFEQATLSKRVASWVTTRHPLVTASCISRDKNQYRLFFSDGAALYITLNNNQPQSQLYQQSMGQVVGIMPMQLTNAATCVCSKEMSTGTEAIFFGDASGFVYQMEKGTSFDGADIEAFMNLVFNNSGTALQQKTYRGALFECEGGGYAEFQFSYELGYGSTEIEQPGQQTSVNTLTPAVWDSFTWDAFYWDGRSLSPSVVDFIGTAENFSFRFRSIGDYFDPLRISGALFHYTPRGRVRLSA